MTAGKLHMLAVLVLAVLCTGLAFGVYGEMSRRPDVPRITLAKAPPLKAAQAAASPEPVAVPAISELSPIVDRPLFFQARKLPEPEPDAPPETKTKPKLSMTVSGVIITPKRRVALIKHPSAKETLHLSVGDRVGEWRLARITRDRIYLEWKDKTESVAVENSLPARSRTQRPRPRRSTARTAPARNKQIENRNR